MAHFFNGLLRIFNPEDDEAEVTVTITVAKGRADVSAIPCKATEEQDGAGLFIRQAIRKQDSIERSVSFLILSDSK